MMQTRGSSGRVWQRRAVRMLVVLVGVFGLVVALGTAPGARRSLGTSFDATQTSLPSHPESLSPSKQPGPPNKSTLADAPAALRAAAIAAAQSGASSDYDLLEADEAETFEGALPAQGLTVRASARGVELGPQGAPAQLGLRLAAAGCEGRTSEARAVAPTAELNRAHYEHPLTDGRAIEAWYVSGPLGLEQGFTIGADWGCASTEILVGVESATVETAKDGLVLASADRGARYRYGELFAHDAEGRELGARMERRDSGALALVVDTMGARFPVVVDPLVTTQEAKLVANDGALNDNFGASIAVSGDTAIMGAFHDDNVGGTDAGSAYIFVRTGTSWALQAKLLASDAAVADQFGISVALSGDTAIVGAYANDNAGGVDAGSAYVFVRSGTTWSQQAKLVASDAAAHALFANSVALAGDTVVVGANNDNTATGSAYVFVRSGTTWSQQAKLVASDAGSGDLFGSSVAVSGDTAIIGAEYDDNAGGMDAGSAYVFVRSGTTWSQQAKLVASDAVWNDRFGNAVAVSGDTTIVGAYYGNNAGGTDAGNAYVFVRSGVTWSQQAKLVASDAAGGSNLGFSVALSGDTAIVGAAWDTNGAGSFAGGAYIFARSGTTWSQRAKLVASDAAGSDFFGWSVGLSGDTAVVGSQGDDNAGGTDAGSAYVFLLENKLDLGAPCSAASQCFSGFCADGVCCGTACGGSDPSDCQACSVATGAATDGTCAPRVMGTTCRPAVGACDVAEACDGAAVTCAADAAEPAGTPCGAPSANCDASVCAGSVGATATCVAAYAPAGTMCSDGSACTAGDQCDASGTCLAGAPVTCNDGNACTSDSCDPTLGCVFGNVADATPCDDGNACSTGDRCLAGACTPTMGLSCEDNNPCTANDCDGMTGCLNTPLAASSPCDDGDACTVGDTCNGSGVCVVGTPLTCDDANECTNDGCAAASGCVFTAKADGAHCSGGVCAGGVCNTGGQGGASAQSSSSQSSASGQGGSAESSTSGHGGSASSASGQGGSAQGGGGAAGSETSGCGCRTAGDSSREGTSLTWLAGALVGVGLVRRRHARRRLAPITHA